MALIRNMLALAATLALQAQGELEGRKVFQLMGRDQGLATEAVVCMAQDRDGFLWMGSENGLVRYEGCQSRRWTQEDGLPSAKVAALAAREDGGLWLGTLRGLVLYKDGRFQRAKVGGVLSTENQACLVLDRKGRLWAFSGDDLVRQREGLDFDVLPWRPGNGIYGITVGPRTGSVYVTHAKGVQVFHEDGSQEAWGAERGLPPQGPVFVAEDGAGRVWAGTGRTLVVQEPGQSKFRDRSNLIRANLSPNGTPYLDRDGSLWLPTQEGAQHLGGEWLAPATGLPFRWVRSVFRDREGSLWVMGPGLAHLLGGGRILNHPLFGGSHGEAGDVVWYMIRDAQGRMIAATDNGAVRMEAAGPRRIPGTEGYRIKGAALDAEGNLWMVNTRGPTLWLRPGRDRAEAAPLGPAGSGVNSVFTDTRGRVWLGSTHRGILRWDPLRRALEEDVPPASVHTASLGVYEFHESPDGRLWASCDLGILVLGAEGIWKLYAGDVSRRIRGMAILPDGTAWIHTEEPSGITRVRLVESGGQPGMPAGRLQIIERRNQGSGLSSAMVYAVRLDGRGHLWATTDKGLDRLDPPLHVGSHDGMISEDCSISALRVEGDMVWVGTSAGLVRFEAPGEGQEPGPPAAAVMSMAFGSRTSEPPPRALPPIPYRDGSVDFRVAAPSYLNDRDLRFQVRLVGLEDGWRDLEGRRIHYPALREGAYRFEVRAAQALGPFGPTASVAFRVAPPWWRTSWAYLLGFLGAFLAILGAVRARMAALRRAKAALEAEVAARTGELSQRNAELSEALGRVKQLTGLLPICSHCKKIRDDRGYWNQLEHYLAEHTEAAFSHGICPDCAQENFPGLLDRRRDRLD